MALKDEYLVVDDEPDICWALERLLTSTGLPCQKALSAQAAIDLAQHHGFRLAFLDLTLPDMKGLELAKRLRQIDPDLRIVILSGFISEDRTTLAQLKHEGLICACITKPFLHHDILTVIDNFGSARKLR